MRKGFATATGGKIVAITVISITVKPHILSTRTCEAPLRSEPSVDDRYARRESSHLISPPYARLYARTHARTCVSTRGEKEKEKEMEIEEEEEKEKEKKRCQQAHGREGLT